MDENEDRKEQKSHSVKKECLFYKNKLVFPSDC